jgi:hypothetical protein
MLKYVFAMIVAISSAIGLSACGSRAETVGTVGGAAVGAGAAAGGYVGHELGREYDKRNR